MKTLRLLFIPILALVFFSMACQKNGHNSNPVPEKTDGGIKTTGTNKESTVPVPEAGACNSNAYIITLESRTPADGGWEWIWSVKNSNPGNGKNGTVQNLSHWGMQFGNCFYLASVISAAYSGDGFLWTSFTPAYEPDPSQTCMTTPVLKFDFGTTGSAKSYYKIVVSEDYPIAATPGYYKSGVNTGCCTFYFTGLGCGEVK